MNCWQLKSPVRPVAYDAKRFRKQGGKNSHTYYPRGLPVPMGKTPGLEPITEKIVWSLLAGVRTRKRALAFI
jgi:hypothetical protein